MNHILNQILIINKNTNFENIEIGQRVSIPLTNYTGRYIGKNKIVYMEDGKPRLLEIINKTVSDEALNENALELRMYNKILGKIKYDSK